MKSHILKNNWDISQMNPSKNCAEKANKKKVERKMP